MLSTWKQPVAGSLDLRPVFTPDITRPIEDALIKARTAFIQQQQQQQFRSQQEIARGRGMPTPVNGYRSTPTPPQINGQFRPPPGQGFSQPSLPQQGFPQQQYSNGAPNGNYQVRSERRTSITRSTDSFADTYAVSPICPASSATASTNTIPANFPANPATTISATRPKSGYPAPRRGQSHSIAQS